jgi:magnesium transporter
VTVIAYGPHELTEFTAADLPALARLRGRYPVVWVNVDGVGHAGSVRQVGEAFGLHRLALEDVMHLGQRAKVEAYEGHLFIVAKMVRRVAELDLEQVGVFLGPDFVVTFQERPGDVFEPLRGRLRAGHARIRERGADYLAYAVLDSIIDHVFPVAEAYADELDALEDQILARPTRAQVGRLHAVKRDLMSLRRALWPLRDALGVLVREPAPLVRPETVVYFRDCQDHAYQVLDLVESYREVGASLTDLYISTVGNRANDIMKVLTVFASIFIPLGFITGVYGMNLDHPDAGFWTWRMAVALMALVALALLAFFWRRGWIGRDG